MSEAGQRHREEEAPRGGSRGRFWSALLWSLIFPQRRQRIMLTMSGGLLIALSLGIGMAAYNAGNNILFITLALLLGCLVLSGVLSWLNFRRVEWQLSIASPLRVGHDATATLELHNTKRVLPTYGLWFDLVARAIENRGPARAETTFTARSEAVKAALAKLEEVEARTTLLLEMRLDPRGEGKIAWVFTPKKRGRLRVELQAVGSLFPFGFLRKSFAAALNSEAIVWPATVEYRSFAVAAARQPAGGERVSRVGAGSDLLALRRYELGDSHRMIHWKASARTGRLLVRQFAAESTDEFSLWVRTQDETWTNAEQFELLLSLAATLADDLFRAGKLASVALDLEPPMFVRRVRDLETYLDRLSVAVWRGSLSESKPGEHSRPTRAAAGAPGARRNLVTFGPDGARGVVAWMGGQRMAAA